MPIRQPGPPNAPPLPQVGVGILRPGWSPYEFLANQDLPPARVFGRAALDPPFPSSDWAGVYDFLPSLDAPVPGRGPRPAPEVPYTGDSLGWAPVEFQGWSVEPARWSAPKPSADTSSPLAPAMGIAPLAPIWGADPPPARAATRPALDSPYPLDAFSGTVFTPLEYLPNQDPWPARVVTKPAIETPYTGDSLGWAPTSWVAWSNEPAARPRATQTADGPSWALASLTLSRFVPWAAEPGTTPRRAPSADSPPWTSPAAVGVFGAYLAWSADPSRPPRRPPAATDIGDPLRALWPSPFGFLGADVPYTPRTLRQGVDSPLALPPFVPPTTSTEYLQDQPVWLAPAARRFPYDAHPFAPFALPGVFPYVVSLDFATVAFLPTDTAEAVMMSWDTSADVDATVTTPDLVMSASDAPDASVVASDAPLCIVVGTDNHE